MHLTAEQQERYSRHLLLDGFDQEKVLQASVAVRGTGQAAHWAARYLASSGVGRLQVDEPAWRDELLSLGPWLTIVVRPDAAADGELVCAPTDDGPVAGALAALETLRQL
jgi:molybdopterin/thiamine biosynthesis adenylyltransferase